MNVHSAHAAAAAALLVGSAAAQALPWATQVVAFDPGTGGNPDLSDPQAVLGPIDLLKR